MKLHFFKKDQSIKKEKKPKGAVKEFIAKLSRGLMLPIAMLPIAGLFLGIGNAISTNCPDHFWNVFGKIISTPGNVIFNNLAVLFAVAIAITFTGDVGVAGLSSFVGWIVFCAIQAALVLPVKNGVGDIDHYNFLFYHLGAQQFNAVFTDNVGIKSLCTSVFGGLIVGFIVAFLYNKFRNIQLPTILGFFSGVRFIPIITFVTMIPLSMFFCLVWPGIGLGLFYFGNALGSLSGYGGINAFLNDFICRSLNPFGLHHAFYTPLWYTSVGGSVTLGNDFSFVLGSSTFTQFSLNGTDYSTGTWYDLASALSGYSGEPTIAGDQKIWMFFSQIAGHKVWLSDSLGGVQHVQLTFDNLSKQFPGVFAGQYMEGRYSIMIFALPAAAFAMLLTVPKGPNRKVAGSIIISAALTSFLTGITEPIEFTFLFLAPALYWGFHAVFCGISAMLMVVVGAHVGMTFSGGFIDWMIYGVLPDVSGAGAKCYWVLILGLIFAVIYFFVFYWAIKHFDIKTPGRDQSAPVIKLYTKKDYLAKKEGKLVEADPNTQLSVELIKAYGGSENIENVDACITKLRVQVKDATKVDEKRLMELGAKGVVHPSKQSVYAVLGTQADVVKNVMKDVISGKIEVGTPAPAPVADTAAAVEVVPALPAKPAYLGVCAPVTGEVVLSKSVKDETFANDLMGHGFAIIPASNEFVAPISGKITLINHHAYAIKAENGVEILIHVGIDTVNLLTKNIYQHYVKLGDEVQAGQKIMSANLSLIRKHHFDTITPVVVLKESVRRKKVKLIKLGQVQAGNEVLTVK